MSSREGAPPEHRRQLERTGPNPSLPRLQIHCATCQQLASTFQIDDGQFLSFWDGYKWYGIAAACRVHGRLQLDVEQTVSQFYAAGRRPDGVARCWVQPMH